MTSSLSRVARALFDRLQFSSFRFSRAYDRLWSLLAYSERERVLKQIMDFVSNCRVEGDYLEFGVFRGGTFAPAYHFATRRGLGAMRFYAFDSFEGIPEMSGIDVDEDGSSQFRPGQFATGMDEFRRLMRRKRVDLDRVTLVPGFYDDSLDEQTRSSLPVEKAAVIWVDCDLYESTVPVLDFVSDYVHDGTVIAFDDWHCFRSDPERGEQRAFREWLEKHPELSATAYRDFEWGGTSFVLRRRKQV